MSQPASTEPVIVIGTTEYTLDGAKAAAAELRARAARATRLAAKAYAAGNDALGAKDLQRAEDYDLEAASFERQVSRFLAV
ncbi:hypothetical protein [Pyxidicoccus sp. MSG2]|uniref:hypothetical protein n=1 Tax=Pyxidicoccus sp. MSG2 TaxID=2996790 RepID=UPI00226F50F3|nr:hypothetical protein [Pyxidicoccus sp. MSG2]MCY1024054.1 hypothetical protein [Pyxidicoccus sp. MSG2]